MEGEGDGAAPRRTHLENAAAKGSARAIAELAAVPPLPPLAAHVWGWFIELGQTRQNNGMGPSPLSRLEIRAWEEDEGRQLQPWERSAIIGLDRAWMESVVAPKG